MFVSLHKALKLAIQVSVLSVKNSAVMTESLDLTLRIGVACVKSLVRETEFLLLASRYGEVVISVAVLALQVVKVSGEISVAAQFNL